MWIPRTQPKFFASYPEPRDTAWFGDAGCYYQYRNVPVRDIQPWNSALMQVAMHCESAAVNYAMAIHSLNGLDFVVLIIFS